MKSKKLNIEAERAAIGQRLRQERSRMELRQEDLAAVGGVSKQTQLNYEAGTHSPDAVYLYRLHQRGLDVGYIVLGTRSKNEAAPGLLKQSMENLSIAAAQVAQAAQHQAAL